MNEFVVKKTNELTDEQKYMILGLFNEVFDKNRTLDELVNQYVNNPLGYSYHSLMISGGKVVGHNSGIPCYYSICGNKELVVCNVDTMIKKGYRGIDNFYDLITSAYNRYKSDGVKFVYGFPNNNSHPLLIKTGLMDDIGKMSVYCLPYRMGGIRKKLAILNPVSKLLCHIYLWVLSLLTSKKTCHFHIEKDALSYNATRYNRMDANYSVVEYGGNRFVYKIMEYERMRIAFLIDVIDKSARNYCKAVKYIIDHESDKFDLLLYVGLLPFFMNGMIKIPHRYEPKQFNFTGKILSNELQDKEMLLDINNWDINLSNYDLI